MKLVPSYRLILWAGIIFLPLTLLMVMISFLAVLTIYAAFAVIMAVAMDAYRSRRRLQGVRIMLPEVIRISQGREGDLHLQIENMENRVRRVRIGLAFPEGIHSPTVDLFVELPADHNFSKIVWPIKGLKQGRYHLDRCFLETASLWGLWLIQTAVWINMEIRVYPNLFDERKNLVGFFLNKRLGIHAQRQIGKGRDFEQLREYLPGDSFEDIHWKMTAKRGEPITKVYQIERTQQIYVIIDASRLSARSPEVKYEPIQEDEPTQNDDSTTMLQRFITAALIMALAAERQGDLFGLLTFDDRIRAFVRAQTGKAHYNVCRDALYTLQPQEVAPDFSELFTFIGTKIRRRALLIFLTHLDDLIMAEAFSENIDLICRQHLVQVNMFKPPAARTLFSSDSISSVNEIYDDLGGHLLWRHLQEIQKVLQRQGVGFSMLDNEHLCTELVSQYLTLKRRQIL